MHALNLEAVFDLAMSNALGRRRDWGWAGGGVVRWKGRQGEREIQLDGHWQGAR